MNKTQFIQVLSEQSDIKETELKWLKEVIDTYPYFAGASYLLTKHYFLQQDFQYQQQLKIAATLSPDRKILYQFIHNDKLFENSANRLSHSNGIKIAENQIQIPKKEELPLPLEEKRSEETPIFVNEDVLLTESLTTENKVAESIKNKTTGVVNVTEAEQHPWVKKVIESKYNTKDIFIEHITLHSSVDFHESEDIELSTDEKDSETSILNTNTAIHVTEFLMNDKAIVEPKSHQKRSFKNIEEEKSNNQKIIPIQNIEEAVENATLVNNVDIAILTSAIENNLDASEILKPKPKFSATESHSFTDWLKNSTHLKTKNIIESIKNSETNSKHSDNKEKTENLLDKFIITQPKISRPKAEFYSPVNMAKQSVADNDELATETLATIYMAQGNFAKALKIYDVLIVKHPEKENYFKKLQSKAKDKLQHKKG